ncbi:MAG: hypothetical protein II877_05060 [Synergistaceae bacterium]|nr:hypothetical protein [Synergistaceae bacterium]
MAVKRDENGRFLPGSVGNPKGRPKMNRTIFDDDEPTPRNLVDNMLPEIITRLGDLMHSDDENVAVQAARALLDWETQQDRNDAMIYKEYI